MKYYWLSRNSESPDEVRERRELEKARVTTAIEDAMAEAPDIDQEAEYDLTGLDWTSETHEQRMDIDYGRVASHRLEPAYSLYTLEHFFGPFVERHISALESVEKRANALIWL